MTRTCFVTADDFGLTQGITDSILEAADGGALTQVSVIPNGYAVENALVAWQKRSSKLSLSIHLNLTEGKALSDPATIPHLASKNGDFSHSPFSLLVASWFFSKSLQKEIHQEIKLQVERIRTIVGPVSLSIDGHQHVHMIPLVFNIIAGLHAKEQFTYIRIPQEPFFVPPNWWSSYVSPKLIRHLGLNFFARINRATAARKNMKHTDAFVGTLLSGELTLPAVQNALGEVAREGKTSVEIAFHPGSAKDQELDTWKGDTGWHYSSWRNQERTLLKDTNLSTLINSFSNDTISTVGSRSLELLRFAIAGGISTATNLGLLYLFTDLFGFWYLASAIVAYATATIISFTLQKFWTFSHHSLAQTHREFALYVANNVLGVVFDLVGLYILVEYLGVWYLLAQFFLLAVIATWNFFVYRFFIFRKPKSI